MASLYGDGVTMPSTNAERMRHEPRLVDDDVDRRLVVGRIGIRGAGADAGRVWDRRLADAEGTGDAHGGTAARSEGAQARAERAGPTSRWGLQGSLGGGRRLEDEAGREEILDHDV